MFTRAFSHDVTAAILVFHNNEMGAIRSLTVITINASCLINDPPPPPTTPSRFSLTWPASMQIFWNKRKRLHKKRSQLPGDCFGTPTWRPFHCFGLTNMAAVTSCKNALCRIAFRADTRSYINIRFCVNTCPICTAQRSFNRAEITVLMCE